MLRKIGLTLLSTVALFNANASFATEYTFSQASGYEFKLPPNEPQIFTNTFFWVVDAKCTIISDSENNPFSFTVLRKSGSLNGVPLSKGDAMELIVHPGDQLHITAASGGRIELVNYGVDTIKAVCVSK